MAPAIKPLVVDTEWPSPVPDRRIGITDQTTAYQLAHLHQYRAKIIRRCASEAADAVKRGIVHRFPGWKAALAWFQKAKRNRRNGRFWLTPPDLYRELDAEFQFDHDPCPRPLPKGFNALTQERGEANYVNPPFSRDDVISGSGATAFVRKAIAEQQKGKTSVIVRADSIRVLADAKTLDAGRTIPA